MSQALIPTGRERRRKGALNRLRRAAFGLLLACGATHAQAFALMEPFESDSTSFGADSLSALAKRYLRLSVQFRNFDDSAADRALFVSQAYQESLSNTGRSLASVAASGSWGLILSADDFNRLREGEGLDLQVPALGKLRLNFRRGDEADAPCSIARGWSLGGSFEQTRVLDGARISGGVSFVPQLVVDLAALTPIEDRLNLSLQYANWHSASGMATEDKQPQLLLKWSF